MTLNANAGIFLALLLPVIYAVPLTWEELQDIRSQCPRLNGRTPVYIPHPSSCSEFFVCDNGRPISMQCPSVLHFNPRLNVCDLESRAGCRAKKTITAGLLKGVGGQRFALMRKDIRCPLWNRETPYFLSHETHCDQYYVCDNGHSIWMFCPNGLHFNTQKNICDYPEAAHCELPTKRQAPVQAFASPVKIPDVADSPQIQSSPGREDRRCPPRNAGFAVLLPHDTSCSLYYVCDYGRAIEMPCPHDLHFNTEKNICDHPENANCKIRDLSPRSNKQSESETAESEAPAEYAVLPVIKKDARCPELNPKTPIFIPHETDCGMYYVCDWGYSILMYCPESTGFNPEENICSLKKPCSEL